MSLDGFMLRVYPGMERAWSNRIAYIRYRRRGRVKRKHTVVEIPSFREPSSMNCQAGSSLLTFGRRGPKGTWSRSEGHNKSERQV